MSDTYIKLPVSRQFTYANFKQDDDIAFMNCGSHYDKGIKFIISENRVYRVLKNNDESDTFTAPEYIIKEKFKESMNTSKYDFQGVLEFTKIPSAKTIKIINIENNLLNYCTQEDLIDYAKKNLNLSLLIGLPIYITCTFHTIGNIKIKIECEPDSNFNDYPICEITQETQIIISNELSSSMKISEIIEVGNFGVIDVIVTDADTCIESKKKEGELDKIMNMIQMLNSTCKKISGDSNQLDQKYILKDALIQQIKQNLMSKCFKLGTKIKLNIDDKYFNVQIDGLNSHNSQNVAFIVKTDDVHINLQNNVSKYSVLDTIYNLHETDKLIFNIVSSKSKVILKQDLITEINLQLENNTILKGHKITVYIGVDKITVILDDVFVKSTNELDSLTKIAYICDKLRMPLIEINDNAQSGIYVTDMQHRYEILSITLRPVKREVVSNFDLATLLKVVSTTDVHTDKIRQYFKYKVKESCIFSGRTYEYDGIKYIVENIQYLDSKVNSKHKIIGIFTDHTDIKFNKDSQDKTINLIDNCNQTSRNLDIETIKGIAKQMENEGLYGMTKHVNKFVKEVLLTRTTLVDENLADLIEPTKGVILYGPPGTGKTTLARNLGKIFGATGSRIKRITATEIKSKWHGESEGNIRKLFAQAIAEYELHGDNAPLHMLIIDEIDAIMGKRGGSISDTKDSIVNQILGEMDGLIQFNNCIIIGITNRLELLDEACLRPGRFGCHIHVDLPNEEQRKLIFEAFHRKLERSKIIKPIDDFNYQLISQLTDGLSGADIKNIYQMATTEHINKKIENIVYIVEPITLYEILEDRYHITIAN